MRVKLMKNTQARGADWLNRDTVYEGKVVSTVPRVVRVYAPDPAEQRPYVDLPYKWLVPVM